MKRFLQYFFLVSFAGACCAAPLAAQSVHSFRFQDADLRTALDSLLRWYAVPLIYLEKDIAGKTVAAECKECNFGDALTKVIENQSLAVRVVGSQVILQARQTERRIPRATIAGTITDSVTGEWLPDATVLLRSDTTGTGEIHRICSTNQFGFYSLQNIRPGEYTLTVRSVGYHTLNIPLAVEAGVAVAIDHALYPRDVVMQEITVEGERSAFAASEGISRGVYIRATPSDQNQYFLEGARIYNPSHFGGVLSTFSGDALRDVRELAGGVPPYYGGRIGGILDMTLRHGRETLSGVAGIGTLGSSLMLEGPVAGETTFLLSGRRGYPDVLLSRNPAGATRSDAGTTEVMAKVSHLLTGGNRVSLSGYFGGDAYDNTGQNAIGMKLFNSLRWRNTAANLRFISILSPSLFVHASAAYSRYGFDIRHRLAAGDITTMVVPSEYFIEDFAVRAHAEHFYDEYHTIRGGVELIRHRFGGTIDQFSLLGAPASFNGTPAWELAVYFQDQWRLTTSVSAELGARATTFIDRQGTFSAVDPRFSILVRVGDETRVYSSLSSVNQFVHPYRNSGVFLFYPTPFMYPSTDAVRPSTSVQISLGWEKISVEGGYSLAIESYYRVTQNLHEFVFDSSDVSFSDGILHGEGTNYGADVTLNRRAGNLTGTVRYSLSLARNRFAELNGGEPYTPRFDRRHELFASLSYALSESWSVGLLCVLATSQGQTGTVSTPAASLEPGPRVENAGSPFDINGGRFPGFQRLELRTAHLFVWAGLPVQATLRLMNGYGLLDPFAWTLSGGSDIRRMWSVRFDPPDLFPLYPVISLNVRF